MYIVHHHICDMRLVCSMFIILTFIFYIMSEFKCFPYHLVCSVWQKTFEWEHCSQTLLSVRLQFILSTNTMFVLFVGIASKNHWTDGTSHRIEHMTKIVWLCFVSIRILIKICSSENGRKTKANKNAKRALEIGMNNNVSEC